jgi:hypothetical protein
MGGATGGFARARTSHVSRHHTDQQEEEKKKKRRRTRVAEVHVPRETEALRAAG